MRRILGTTIILITFYANVFAISLNQTDVCVKYETRSGWSKGYAVQGHLRSGTELNRATNSFRFKSHSDYVVVFWGEGQATILQLPAFSSGRVPIYERRVKDQEGRNWRIKSGHMYCF